MPISIARSEDIAIFGESWPSLWKSNTLHSCAPLGDNANHSQLIGLVGMSSRNVMPSTFESLYSDHHGWLESWLRSRLQRKSDAPDLTQDTFLRVLRRADAALLAQLREPRHYLVTVANRVMIDYLRRQTLERAWLEALALEPESEAISPEAQNIILETLKELDVMLHGLGPKVRSAFLMSQLEGLTYAEISLRLGVSVSSIKKYMARATEKCLLYMLEMEV